MDWFANIIIEKENNNYPVSNSDAHLRILLLLQTTTTWWITCRKMPNPLWHLKYEKEFAESIRTPV